MQIPYRRSQRQGKICHASNKLKAGLTTLKHFTCCDRHVSEEGCVEDDEHRLPSPNDPLFLEYWQYHGTPSPILTLAADSTAAAAAQTSPRKGKKKKYQPLRTFPQQSTQTLTTTTDQNLPAIALDCEMGTSTTGESELIRLTAVDFFTGNILIDNLVSPSVPMAHYNTRYSGVTPGAMHHAVRTRTAIHGRDRARLALLQYCGPDTVIIVHGGSSDFSALRWIHPLIIDSCILEGYNGVKVPGGKSLQNLAKVKLGREIQVRDPKRGVFGHDSYEDAMACRELVVYFAESIPDGL